MQDEERSGVGSAIKRLAFSRPQLEALRPHLVGSLAQYVGGPAWTEEQRREWSEEVVERFLHEAACGALPTLLGDGETRTRTIPPPLTIRALLERPEPEERWIGEGIVPADANVLLAGYPKTFKTFLAVELAVAAATGTPFLGRFRVPREHRVALVVMEDRPHRVRRRIERLCQGRAVRPEDLEGYVHLWFRPPLTLAPHGLPMLDLRDYVAELDLDLLIVDSWAYVASGNSDSADEVTPQLGALSALRDECPGLTVMLLHHARKQGREISAERLTDLIRNSSAFGAWYDLGIVLSRRDEASPVTLRCEARDLPTPEPFAFEVEDEIPADPHGDNTSRGWLRLVVSEHRPEVLERMAAAERLKPAVLDFLRANQGCSKRKLRGIGGDNMLVEAAFELLCEEGAARYEGPDRPGKSGKCWPAN